jgi:hypothetical protein
MPLKKILEKENISVSTNRACSNRAASGPHASADARNPIRCLIELM